MASLTAIFGNSPESDNSTEQDSEKLLNLYWNRAELKKEFAELRADNLRLQDRVKQQEGATARVQQKLDHLENLLLDPDWVYSVVTYFQLRALNQRCERRLARFAEELKQQREKKQYSQLISDWNEQRELEAGAIETEIGAQRVQLQLLEDELQADRHRLASMNGVIKLFRKRALMRALDGLSAKIDAAQAEETALLQRYDEVQNRQPPDTQGLTIAAKRMINFMILAFAQQQYLLVRKDGLAGLAKEAGDKSVGAVNYGGKEATDRILADIARRLAEFEKASNFADVVRKRARLIAEKALFRNDDDAVPLAHTVAIVYDLKSSGEIREEEVNLLGENYWNLAQVVSR